MWSCDIAIDLHFFRVLVFYDDGFAQYTTLDKIHLVCESGTRKDYLLLFVSVSWLLFPGCNIWEEVARHSREFIQRYLDSYPIVSHTLNISYQLYFYEGIHTYNTKSFVDI